MKTFLLFGLIFISAFTTQAQSNEISLQVSSGLFGYGGYSAAGTSRLYISDIVSQYGISTPFGTRSGFSYGIALQSQRITKNHFIWGLRVGYDQLTSSTQIKDYLTMGGTGKVDNGKATLSNNIIHADPHFGYRVSLNQVRVDFTAGLNIGYILKSTNHLTFELPGGQPVDEKSENRNINTKVDIAPMAGVAVSYKRFAVSANYEYGLINYQRNLDGANREVYARYLRMGLAYRLF